MQWGPRVTVVIATATYARSPFQILLLTPQLSLLIAPLSPQAISELATGVQVHVSIPLGLVPSGFQS
jgi:hypothetical protein